MKQQIERTAEDRERFSADMARIAKNQPVAGHTPVEWVLLRDGEGDGTGLPLQYKAGMAYKVALGRINYCMVYAPESEREAISELIASAPRLVRENAALKQALVEMMREFEYPDDEPEPDALILARAALALAGKEAKS